jgi:peptidoglycan/xylan/chitin deacetylase (PgdA/CDA1 family)
MAISPDRRKRQSRRRLAFAVGALALVVASATGTASLLPGSMGVAVGGQLPMHQRDAGPFDSPDVLDGPPLFAGPQPVVLSLPAGPHLTVPILYYHYIRDIRPTAQNQLSIALSISPALFAQQMALLHVEGAHPITLAMLMDALEGKSALPANPVVLTFDDGYADFATSVEPVMERYGFVATDYVVSGFLNRPRYMTAAQVQEMDAAGMVIGSHTVHHVNLANVPLPVALAEIEGGKAALEQLLGHPVLDFAYPYGGFDPAVEQLVQQAGFSDAVTTMGGDTQTLGARFALRRTELGGAPGLAAFAEDAGLPAPTGAQTAAISAAVRPLGRLP